MFLNGKEYGLMLTLKAMDTIASLTPDGDYRNIGEVLNGKNMMRNVGKVLAALSEGYADYEEVIEGRERPPVLTEKMLGAMSVYDIANEKVMSEITEVVEKGKKTTIEAEPIKSKNAEGEGTA